MSKLSNAVAAVDRFFTTARRKSAYKIVGVLAALAVAHGLLTADDAKAWLEIAAELAGVGTAALAHRNAK